MSSWIGKIKFWRLRFLSLASSGCFFTPESTSRLLLSLTRHNHILLLCYLTVELEILSVNLNPRNLEAFLVIRYRFGC